MHLLIVQEFNNVKHALLINVHRHKQAQKVRRSATVAIFKGAQLINNALTQLLLAQGLGLQVNDTKTYSVAFASVKPLLQ